MIFLFHIKNPKKQILKWSDKIQLKEFFSYYKKTPRNPRWKIRTRIMLSLCDIFDLAMFIHLKFKEYSDFVSILRIMKKY